ncbi:MAG: endolytic transglycosylase MltG [Bacteroidales bacterium]|nr:endolytic transglycosylase MltG [Bacteroidales bacterium]
MKKVTVALLVVALLVGAIVGYGMYYDRKVPNFDGTAELFVYPGMSVSEVADSLVASGVVKNPKSVTRCFKKLSSVAPGHYSVDGTCTSMYVARMLRAGWQTPVNLTLSGSIRTYRSLARKVGAQMLLDSAAVASFAVDSLGSYGLDTLQLFTRVIPDTYQMLWTASARDIFERLFKESDAWWTADRIAAAKRQGLTKNEAITLASIVDGETRYVPEQPTIAGVYLNRLHSGMKLQADPTVAYCFGYTLNRILKAHLAVDSPYNTYKYFGLPPGPISCPPKACLEAVLNPASHNYLFFCADPSFNGSHRFAATYAEHMINARAFQRALTERQKSR